MLPNRKQLEFMLFVWLRRLIRIFPRSFCLSLGAAIGILVFWGDRKHRRLAFHNLETAFGRQRTGAEKKQIAKHSFAHFGRTLIDIIKLGGMERDRVKKIITVEGREHLEEALKAGKGSVLFSAHYGNWEIAPVVLTQFGRLDVIARRLDNLRLEEELTVLRSHFGGRVIYKQKAAKQVLRFLREGHMIAILMDQNVLRSQAVFVDFFGKDAATTPSTALFHIRTGTPLLPVFCIPSSRRTYRLVISPPLPLSLIGDRDRDIQSITQACTSAIEQQIRDKPDFWLWFHNRWKTRPVPE